MIQNSWCFSLLPLKKKKERGGESPSWEIAVTVWHPGSYHALISAHVQANEDSPPKIKRVADYI